MDRRFWYGEPFSHLPCSMGWQVVGVSNIHIYMCVCLCVYIHTEGGLAPAPSLPRVVDETVVFATTGEGTSLFPAPFGIMAQCCLGGSARGHLVQLPHWSRALFTGGAGDGYEPDGDILQVPCSLQKHQCWSRPWAVWYNSCKGNCLFSPKGCSRW